MIEIIFIHAPNIHVFDMWGTTVFDTLHDLNRLLAYNYFTHMVGRDIQYLL